MMRRRPVVVRRRGPGLVGTAVVGGMAYSAGKSAANSAALEASQQARLDQLEQQQMYAQAAPPPAPASATPASSTSSGEDRITKLQKLGELRTSGVLTDAEFETEKQKLLSGA